VQRINILASGDSVIKNIDVIQSASISVSILQSAANDGSLQADIVSNLVSELKDKTTTDPLKIFSGDANDQIIENIIKNNVNSTFSSESMMELNNTIEQEVNVTGVGAGVIDGVRAAQTANMVMKAVNTMTNSLTADLIAATDVKNSAGKEESSVIVDGIVAVGNAIKDGIDSTFGGMSDLVGIDASTLAVIFLIVLIVAALAAYKVFVGKKTKAPKVIEPLAGGFRSGIYGGSSGDDEIPWDF